MTWTIDRLMPDAAAGFRDLRLDGLRDHPEAFGASWDDEAGQPLDWFAARLRSGPVFGGRGADGRLAGMLGLGLRHATKQRHKAMLWGMYVRPASRGTGLGGALLRHAVAAAAGTVEELTLGVGAGNGPARRLYEAAGFRAYAIEQRALKLGDVYVDEVLMALPLPGAATGL